MNSSTVEIVHKIESTLSEILPDLYQLLQSYQMSSTLEIHLFDLADNVILGSCWCVDRLQNPCRCNRSLSSDLPGLDTEKTQQFCADFDSILSTILPRLSQAAQQTDESFEVHFLFDPATVNSAQPVVFQGISDGILKCSNLSDAENFL
jgi:hypothetical protein